MMREQSQEAQALSRLLASARDAGIAARGEGSEPPFDDDAIAALALTPTEWRELDTLRPGQDARDDIRAAFEAAWHDAGPSLDDRLAAVPGVLCGGARLVRTQRGDPLFAQSVTVDEDWTLVLELQSPYGPPVDPPLAIHRAVWRDLTPERYQAICTFAALAHLNLWRRRYRVRDGIHAGCDAFELHPVDLPAVEQVAIRSGTPGRVVREALGVGTKQGLLPHPWEIGSVLCEVAGEPVRIERGEYLDPGVELDDYCVLYLRQGDTRAVRMQLSWTTIVHDWSPAVRDAAVDALRRFLESNPAGSPHRVWGAAWLPTPVQAPPHAARFVTPADGRDGDPLFLQ